jgi:glycosyltransferase involved in cell wall biosynthesis
MNRITDIGIGSTSLESFRIAVLVPCRNEEAAIGEVIRICRTVLPHATVYVYDNNSSDRTMEVARGADAVVRRETHQGKGHVVRRMFADIEADVYVLIDGDGTYDLPSAPAMIGKLVEEQLDMVVGARVYQEDVTYRPGHVMGNRLLTGFVAAVFGGTFTDMLSGYRVFSRRFVKSFPVLSSGFEIETELTVHALELGLPVAEVTTPYYARAQGSASKLNTWRDGRSILWTIVRLYRSERPFLFFSMMGGSLALIAIALAIPLFVTYFRDGLVERVPTAILVTGMMVLAFLLSTCGLILDTVTRGRQEIKRLAYLSQGFSVGHEDSPVR